MELVLIGIAALLVSGLTLFSGFGLGTVLMPVFALFFPLPLAIAATAVVHFANNIFKFGLMAKLADWRVVAPLNGAPPFAPLAGGSPPNLFEKILRGPPPQRGGRAGGRRNAPNDPPVSLLGHQAELENIVGEMHDSGGCDSQRQREEQSENRHQNCPKTEA